MKSFLIGIDSEWAKTYFLKRKSRLQKKYDFPLGTEPFFFKNGCHRWKNGKNKKSNLLIGVYSEQSERNFEMKIQISKNFAHYNFSLEAQLFFLNGDHGSKKWQKKIFMAHLNGLKIYIIYIKHSYHVDIFQRLLKVHMCMMAQKNSNQQC